MFGGFDSRSSYQILKYSKTLDDSIQRKRYINVEYYRNYIEYNQIEEIVQITTYLHIHENKFLKNPVFLGSGLPSLFLKDDFFISSTILCDCWEGLAPPPLIVLTTFFDSTPNMV